MTIRRAALLFLIFFAPAGFGIAFPGSLDRYVTDEAGVLDADAAARLESLLIEVKQKTAAEIAVVTLPSLEGRPIEEAATELFQKWGIGEKGRDNGVLFLIALEDRKMRIEVGYGLEPVIPDGLAGRILDTSVLPSFRENQYQQGIIQGTVVIARMLAAHSGVELSGEFAMSQTRARPLRLRSVIFSGLLLLIFIILFARNPWLLLFLLSNRGGGRGGWSGGGFGGGFGGFGGGMSGGGGASRGW